jgi:hypothetical protein
MIESSDIITAFRLTRLRAIDCRWLLPAAVLLLFARPGLAQISQLDIHPAADAAIYEGGTLLANGSGAHLFVGKTNHAEVRRSLIRFDIAGNLPRGSRVISAELQMTIDRTAYFSALDVGVHRLLSSWAEGPSDPLGNEGGGAPAAAGDCTWLHRSLPGSPWFAAGGDFDGLPSSVATTPSQLGPVVWPSTPRMVLDVQSWLEVAASNHGWMLLTDELQAGAARRFASRTNAAQADRPRLRIRFLPPGSVAAFAGGCPPAASTMSATGTFLPATTMHMVLQGGPGASFGAIFLALGVAEPGAALFPGCRMVLEVGTLVPAGAGLLDPAGQLAWPIAIPPLPSFTGLLIAAQSLVDAPASAAGLELSAATAVVLP